MWRDLDECVRARNQKCSANKTVLVNNAIPCVVAAVQAARRDVDSRVIGRLFTATQVGHRRSARMDRKTINRKQKRVWTGIKEVVQRNTGMYTHVLEDKTIVHNLLPVTSNTGELIDCASAPTLS